MAGFGNRIGMRPQLPTIRTPTGLANAPAPVPGMSPGSGMSGGPINTGADPFNRPVVAPRAAPQPVSPAAKPVAVKPTLTPAGNVGAAGPVSGATVPTPPLMATVGTPPGLRPQLR